MDFLKRRPLWTALGGLVCFLVAFALVWGFAGRFRSGENRQVAGDILRVAAPEAAQPREGETASPSVPPEATPDWIVYVTGEVRHPGIVRVPPESRVYEAVDKAGGLTEKADPEGVNLAALLRDGDHVRVPEKGAPPAVGGSAAGSPAPRSTTKETEGVRGGASPQTATVDPNRATAKELEALPGVGPKTGEAIVAFREANGPFRVPEDLLRVKGIGPKKLEQMRPFLRLSP